MFIFNMCLQQCVWYSAGGIIGLGDKNQICTPNVVETAPITRQSIYPPCPVFPPSIICFDKIFAVYWLYSLITSTCIHSLHVRKPTPYSYIRVSV